MGDCSKPPSNLLPEQEAIRAKCFHPTGTFVEFAKKEVEQSIPERLENIVRTHPDRPALKAKNLSWTYDELNQSANRIAHAILNGCTQGTEPIALLLEPGASPVVAMIGVLKAGKTYVPLDPHYPRSRLQFMLQDCRATVVVTDSQNYSFARQLAQDTSELINIDKLDSALPTDGPDSSRSPNSLAYIMYTSGSTGQPKGVMQTDRNVLHEIMNYTNAAGICHNDRLLLVSSPSFADATRTIYGALLNGACLCPLNIKEEGLVRLAPWLLQEEITIYRSVPSVFRHLIDTLSGNEEFPHLRLIYSGGDTVTWADIESYKNHFSSSCVFVNGLGSSESLTYRWYFINKETPVTGSTVPVGYGLEDQDVILLDDQGGEIVGDEIGQVAVTSRYLSPGYWNRPDLTRAAFHPGSLGPEQRFYLTGDMGRMGSDGCLMHLGRKDFQVKIRGQRIEVAEVEGALVKLDTIKEAVVVAREIRLGERSLVAYLVPRELSGPNPVGLRRALTEKLPDYMIPSSYVWLDALPLNANRKVDRRALPDPGSSRPKMGTPFVAPGTATEELIAAIWAEILGIDEIGRHDNFFDLGGHSLAATRVVFQVIKKFELELPLESLFGAPTIAEMAAVIAEHQAKEISKPELDRILAELESISEEKARQLLADAAATNSTKELDE